MHFSEFDPKDDGHCGRSAFAVGLNTTIEDVCDRLISAMRNPEHVAAYVKWQQEKTGVDMLDGLRWAELVQWRINMYERLNLSRPVVGEYEKYLNIDDVFFLALDTGRTCFITIKPNPVSSPSFWRFMNGEVDVVSFEDYVHHESNILLQQRMGGHHLVLLTESEFRPRLSCRTPVFLCASYL